MVSLYYIAILLRYRKRWAVRRKKRPPEFRRSFVRYFFFRFLEDCFGAAS